MAAKLENFTLPRTFGVFCNSAHTYSLVSSRAKRTWRVPNALRTAFFYRPEIIRAPASQITFLVVGVVTPNKRQVELLALFIRLRQYYTCFQVKFVGSCGDNPYSRAFLEKLTGESQSTWATWLGVLDESSLMHCMDESQVLVHFPLEESFGLVVAEALARGLKLFASKVGGIRDIASGVPEAELFDPEDWEGLQDSLLRWIQNPTPSSTQTQQLMRMRYDPKTIASRHLEIYREVLSASNPS